MFSRNVERIPRLRQTQLSRTALVFFLSDVG
jgi:hypothetical protein